MGAQNAGSVGRGFLAYPAYPRPFSGQAAEQVPDAICLVCAMQAQPAGRGDTQVHREHRPWARLGPGHAPCRSQDLTAFLGSEHSGGGRTDFRPFLLNSFFRTPGQAQPLQWTLCPLACHGFHQQPSHRVNRTSLPTVRASVLRRTNRFAPGARVSGAEFRLRTALWSQLSRIPSTNQVGHAVLQEAQVLRCHWS